MRVLHHIFVYFFKNSSNSFIIVLFIRGGGIALMPCDIYITDTLRTKRTAANSQYEY